MKIAVVTSSYPSATCDYAGHFVAADVRELERAGHDVTVIAPGKAPEPTPVPHARHVYLGCSSAFGPPGVWFKLRAQPTAVFSLGLFLWRARLALGQHGPWDRVICHWLVPNGWPLSLGITAEREWVAHGSDVRLLCRLPRLVGAFILRGVGPSRRLRFVSHELQQALSQHLGCDLSEFGTVRPCPIEVSRTPARVEARRALGIAEDERVAVVVGRLIESKRVDVALEALARTPELNAVVIGDGPCMGALRHAYPRAKFMGELGHQETLSWISAADVLVSASELEGAPTAIREATALGVRVALVNDANEGIGFANHPA